MKVPCIDIKTCKKRLLLIILFDNFPNLILYRELGSLGTHNPLMGNCILEKVAFRCSCGQYLDRSQFMP